MDQEKPRRELNRRTFIKSSAGVATGVAVAATPAAVVLGNSETGQPRQVVSEPSSPMPAQPVMAYVRDAERGEVTVLAGAGETTYRDPALVRHLLDASNDPRSIGGSNVVAP